MVEEFLQKYVSSEADALDVGGDCEFINCVICRRKFVVDINSDVKKHAAQNVTVISSAAQSMAALHDDTFDVAFASNFFEHITSREEVLDILQEIRRVQKPRGRFLIIQPNVKYAYKEYWSFFDHKPSFTHTSFIEVLMISSFEIEACYPRFLTFSTKSNLSKFPSLLRVYLHIKLLWKIFGKQFFIIAGKPA